MNRHLLRAGAVLLVGFAAAARVGGVRLKLDAANTSKGVVAQTNDRAAREWRTYGHDPGGMRFSPLTQITPANVNTLEIAWVYHMKPAAPPSRSDDAPEPP